MCSVLKEIGVITLPPENIDESSTEVKCHWPEREIKFSFKLKEDDNAEVHTHTLAHSLLCSQS
jgi:hypothetical protein